MKKMDNEPEWKEPTDEEIKEMLRQFKEDSEIRDFSDSDMDKIFQATMDYVVKKNRRKKILKVASVAASIMLLVGVALNGFTQVAYGESLIDIVKNSIEAGQFTLSAIGADDKSNQFEKFENDIVCYEDSSIEGLFEQITNDTQIGVSELFLVKDVPSEYVQWTAKYNKDFDRLTINSRQESSYIYILEELNYESIVSGTALESQVASNVFNENLQMNIAIMAQMDNVRLQGYYIEVFYDNKRLFIEGNWMLNEFEQIAKNITLLKGD